MIVCLWVCLRLFAYVCVCPCVFAYVCVWLCLFLFDFMLLSMVVPVCVFVGFVCVCV